MNQEEHAKQIVEMFIRYADTVFIWPENDREAIMSPNATEINAKACAILHVEGIIKEIEQLRKPEYTTFVIRYAENIQYGQEPADIGETMDGYEKIAYYEEIKTIINNSK